MYLLVSEQYIISGVLSKIRLCLRSFSEFETNNLISVKGVDNAILYARMIASFFRVLLWDITI